MDALVTQQQSTRRAKAIEMAERYRAGATLQEIGDYYGVTRERVRQIMTRELGITARDGGKAQRGRERKAANAARRDLRYLRKYGVTRTDYVRINQQIDRMGKKPSLRFHEQRSNARVRNIEWNLTFGEWWSIWEQSGRWLDRGRGNGYVMARHGDRGAYEAGNVKIIHAPQNNSEYIRRYWSEVRAGRRQPPKNTKHGPLHNLEIGQTIALPITQKRPIYAQNYAHNVARDRGWKLRTSIKTGDLVVTRIA